MNSKISIAIASDYRKHILKKDELGLPSPAVDPNCLQEVTVELRGTGNLVWPDCEYDKATIGGPLDILAVSVPLLYHDTMPMESGLDASHLRQLPTDSTFAFPILADPARFAKTFFDSGLDRIILKSILCLYSALRNF